MQQLVIITERLDQRCADWLGQHAEVVWCPHDNAAELDLLLPRAAGLVVRTYTQVDESLLERAPGLKVVGRAGVGLDNIDLDACRKRGVQVAHTPDANTQAVVEYVLGLILDELRPRHTLNGHVSASQFHELRKVHIGSQLSDLTLGILGFGRIGKRLGRVAHSLDVQVKANDLIPEAELRAAVDFPFEYVDKPVLWAESDILSVHVDGRNENCGMIDAQVLSQLKPTCMLVNTSRGMVMDNAALAEWVSANPRARAVLDVHEPEPPTNEYPFFDAANVRVLPHLASRTHAALENMSWVVKDVAAVLQGQCPQYPAW